MCLCFDEALFQVVRVSRFKKNASQNITSCLIIETMDVSLW